MKNVICDICGTAYPASASKCPICGSSREYALENTGAAAGDFSFLEMEEETQSAPRKNKEIFDYDEVNQRKPAPRTMDDDDFDEDEEAEEEESESNVGLVIVLVILIVALLLTAGFFFVRYLLPGMLPEETVPATTAAVVTEAAETTDPVKPCTNLMIDGGKMELGKDGKKLLNVRIYPEDTTDTLVFTSGDEAVVTVSEDGTVTAVGEGQTVITITCGVQTISCNVTVDYTVGQETVAPEAIPGMEVENADSTAATDGTGAAEETEAAEATVETTAATEGAPKLKLKLDPADITIGAYRASVQLELEGDLDPKDVKWFTMDSTVAICHDGLVTSTGTGMTKIYGEYGGEQVMCIVRCIY